MRAALSTEKPVPGHEPAPAGKHASAAAGRRRPRGWVLAALSVLAVVFVVRAGVAQPLRVATHSMEPTLGPGEHVLASTLDRLDGHWQRGDVVAFRRPGDDRLLVKRIVGLGGDTVAIRDGRLVVNGERVAEPYADPARIDSVFYGPVRVPAGEVLVLGDNRRSSQDSRSFGPVPVSALEGRIVAVVWPLGMFDKEL